MRLYKWGDFMSVSNPFDISGHWRVDPDRKQDRSDGPCIVRQMTEEEKIKYGVSKEENNKMAHMTKDIVKKMAESGMNTAEIAEYFMQYYPNVKKTMLIAKVAALLSDKSIGRPKKKVEPKPEAELKPVPENEPEQEIEPEPKLEPLADEIEKTNIKEVTEMVKKQTEKAVAESLEKIKLRQEVDEMMEMIPAEDSINNPKYYTSGKIEVIEFIQDKLTPEEFEGFCKGVIIQYIIRSRLKGGLKDLKKAQWYLNKIIKTKEAG